MQREKGLEPGSSLCHRIVESQGGRGMDTMPVWFFMSVRGKGNSQMGGVMAKTGVSSNTGTTTRKPFVPCYSYGEMEQEAER